jgi:hypothetical protein
LERELIEAGDQEKERLGRELHDGWCQNLPGITGARAGRDPRRARPRDGFRRRTADARPPGRVACTSPTIRKKMETSLRIRSAGWPSGIF